MRSPLVLLHATLLALPLSSACSSGGGGGESGAAPLVLGTVTTSGQPCTGGVGNLPGTTCQRLVVSGLGNVPIDVELRITDPVGPPIGTALMSSGGEGTGFYAELPGGERLLTDLVTAGFRVVDRRWATGWFTTGEGFLQQSGRYATLATWVHDNLLVGPAFCASGNSAGAAEIAYSLTAWERGSILDAAVLSSGPPLTRLDYGCANPIPPEWFTICPNIVPAGMLDCGVSACSIGNEVLICPFLPQNPAVGELEAESILAPGATLSFPDTFVFVAFGADDCTISVPLGMLFVQAVQSPLLLQFVPGAPHQMPATDSGRAAIVNALIAAALNAAQPATAAPGSLPVVQGYEPVPSSPAAPPISEVAVARSSKSRRTARSLVVASGPKRTGREVGIRTQSGRDETRTWVSDAFGRLYWLELSTVVTDLDGERTEQTVWQLRDPRTSRVVHTGVVRSSRPGPRRRSPESESTPAPRPNRSQERAR